MANGQPVIQGGVNVASAPTALAATTITGNNKTTFSAYGGKAGVGLYGTALPLGPNLLSSDTGVIGAAPTTGVLGVSDGGVVDDGNGNIVVAGAGVAGVSGTGGVGVHGTCSAGFGVLGQDATGIGVQGKSVAGLGVVGDSVSAAGVTGRSSTSVGVAGEGKTAQGVLGKSVSSAGVAGTSASGSGVHGRSVGGIGVVGGSTESIGVYGSARSKPGVRGDSDSHYGVLGMSTTGNGVHGWSTQGPAGVSGYSPSQRALSGLTFDGYGVWAQSTTHIGVVGVQSSNQLPPSGAGVVGMGENGIGVVAFSRSSVSLYAKSVSNLAARFDGAVEVHGSFKVIGGPKSAVVPHKDGTHRQLYCMESPESWFEDFGEARLFQGMGKVSLDADFAALIHTSDYQVFLTPYDAAHLYVSKRTTQGFDVRAMPGADGAVPKAVRFGYRIVARRADIKAPRLAKVKVSTAALDFVLPKVGKGKPGVMPAVPKVAIVEPKPRAASAVPPAPQRPDLKQLNRVFDARADRT